MNFSADFLKDIAVQTRRAFERDGVDFDLLSQEYQQYNPVPDVDVFIYQARRFFPALNCGLASVYLRRILGEGQIVYGSYAGHGHTFLLLGRAVIVDITSDQFGGDDVYVGPVVFPYGLTHPMKV